MRESPPTVDYAEWLALWTDDAVYWVPATSDPDADPQRHLSHVYDNRARLETRVALGYQCESIARRSATGG